MSTKQPTPKSIAALLAEAKVTGTLGEPASCWEEGDRVVIGWDSGVDLKMVVRAEQAIRRAGLRGERGWHGSNFRLIVSALPAASGEATGSKAKEG
jgi:hypothetical protein